MMPLSKCKTFSLIELMVVVAIISGLISLLVPSLKKMNDSASKLHCTSNLKSIGVAMHHYIDDHDGWMPVALDRGKHKTIHHAYVGEIAPYLGYENDPWIGRHNPHMYEGAPEILQCVSEDGFSGGVLAYGWNWRRLGSYRDNEWGRRKN